MKNKNVITNGEFRLICVSVAVGIFTLFVVLRCCSGNYALAATVPENGTLCSEEVCGSGMIVGPAPFFEQGFCVFSLPEGNREALLVERTKQLKAPWCTAAKPRFHIPRSLEVTNRTTIQKCFNDKKISETLPGTVKQVLFALLFLAEWVK